MTQMRTWPPPLNGAQGYGRQGPSDETFFQSRISPKCLTLRGGGQALNLRLPESLYPGARALPMDRPHVFVCHLQEG